MQQESVQFKNISTSQPFKLNLGGNYALEVVATFGGGSVEVQAIGPDGTTFLSLPTPMKVTANGEIAALLPPGQYQLTVTTATAVFAAVTRVPTI